ncbi:MAG TPA: hypothetical protein VIS51_03860 [Solirubrobacterales bacterium]
MVAASFLLVPASQAAAADFPLVITTDGSGEGTVECDVEGGGAEPCDAEYEEGTELSLVAEPDPGSEFVEFYGDCGPAECELTMDAEHSVTATFEAEEEEVFSLTVETAGNGSGTVECEVEAGPEPCEEEYLEGTELSLVAEADPGSEFVEWIGDCGPENCELTMDEEHSVTALFELEPQEFDLEINFDGSGSGEVECEAQEGLEECQETYPEGTELTLIPVPDPGSEFVEFSGECKNPAPVCELVMDQDQAVTVTFEEEGGERELDINIVGEGDVECEVEAGPEPCDPEYESGTELTLVAVPDSGFEFDGFSGGTGSATGCTTSPCSFTLTQNSSVTATFSPEGPAESTLSVTTAGTGTGEVKCKFNGGSAEACNVSKPNGTTVEVIATANSGSEFAGFSSGTGSASACSTSPCSFTLNANSSVTATFTLIPRTLTVTTAGTGTGEVKCKFNGGSAGACTSPQPNGTTVEIIATANVGSTFAGFSGGTGSASSCSTSPCSFTITANSAVTATFNLEAPTESTLTVTTAGTGTGEVKCKFNGGSAEACNVSKPNGTTVEVIATANSGSEFAGFSSGTGSASACSTSPCSFTLNANSSVTATFTLIPRTLTVTKTGTGTGTIQCKFNGGSAGACTSPQPNGTTVEIIATANAGSTFAGFSSGTGSASSCSTSPCSFTITANSAVTGTFTLIPRTLTVTTTGTGTGEVKCKFNGGSAGACTSPQPNGTTVEIIATANAGSEFAGFSGGTGSAASCSTSPCSFTITANSAVTATFNLKPVVEEFALTIVKAGSGSGSVTCNGGACAAKYVKGTKVALAASAASGSTFSGWSGGGCSGTGGCTVTVEADTTVTATFTADTPPPPTEGKVKAAGSASVKNGKANLKITCTGGPCKGTLKLKAKVKQGNKTKNLVIGKASFSLAEGATSTLKVKLSGPAKQELAKGKTVKATTSGTGVTSSKVKLKPPKKK